MSTHCGDCGANLALVGIRHRCMPRLIARAVNKRMSPPDPASEFINGLGRRDYMRDAQAKWRAANPDLSRERAREGMRKRRAKEKTNV